MGISPWLNFDEGYRTVLELMARQVGAAIAGARAYEEERRRGEMLAELDRAKTAFFSNVSHEFPFDVKVGTLGESGGELSQPARRRRIYASPCGIPMFRRTQAFTRAF